MQTSLKVLWVLVSCLAAMVVIVSLPDNWGEEMMWMQYVLLVSTVVTAYGSIAWSFPKRLRSGLAGEISAFVSGTVTLPALMIGFAFPCVSGKGTIEIVSGIVVSVNSVALFALMMWWNNFDATARRKA